MTILNGERLNASCQRMNQTSIQGIGLIPLRRLKKIVDKCDVRNRVGVLIMLSTGMRIGGLRELCYGAFTWSGTITAQERIDITPFVIECAAAIDDYLAVRQRIGEQLKEKSPLIRDKFSIDNYFKAPRFLSVRPLSLPFEEVLKKADINQINPGQKKREVMQSHGFRKFFITQCDKAGPHLPLVSISLVIDCLTKIFLLMKYRRGSTKGIS